MSEEGRNGTLVTVHVHSVGIEECPEFDGDQKGGVSFQDAYTKAPGRAKCNIIRVLQ